MPDLSAPPQPTTGHGLLAGRTAVITAAAGTGIGSATARRLLDEGADVVVSDWHERRLKQTEEELAAEFPDRTVASVVCDVTSTAQVDELVRAAAERLGRIDVMVNNAGLGGRPRSSI